MESVIMETTLYKISQNALYGRYLTAAKDIKQGQIILKESPIAIGPQVGGPSVCFNCCHQLKKAFVLCPQCNIALFCSPQCNSGEIHSKSECEVLKSTNLKATYLASNPEVILPLRCLLLRLDLQIWTKFSNLESHLESRRNTSIWRRHKINVEDPLKSFNFLTEDDLKLEIVQKVCGIIDVNAFEVRPPQNNFGGFSKPIDCLRGVYPLAALMAHDCIANTHGAVDENFVLWIRAAVDIKQGEAIYFNYGSPLQGCLERRQHLQKGKYFNCECRRCLDNTELQTEMSSLNCPRCREGWVRPIFDNEKIETNKNWICSSCERSFSNSLIGTTISEGRRKIHDLDLLDIVAVEKLLKNFSTTFHPQHFLVLEVEQNLVRLYTQTLPNKKNLIRQIQLCSKLLEIFRKVEPGISRIQAITLYKLHTAQVNLAQKDYNNREISGNQFVEKLLEAECNLKASTRFLLYEPQKSPEGRLAQKALSDLKMLRLSITNVQRSLIDNPEPTVTDNVRTKKGKGKKKK